MFVWLVADGWCWFVLREKSYGLFVWLVADGWCWFVLREKYCWLVAGGWFVLREKYCWLVADKPSEQAVNCSFNNLLRMKSSFCNMRGRIVISPLLFKKKKELSSKISVLTFE
jgi:hypothetical protein